MFSTYKNPRLTPVLMVLLGLTGLVLRLLLDADGTDRSGLIKPWSIWVLLLCLLVIGILYLAVAATACVAEVQGYQRSFPGSVAGAAGHCMGALGAWFTVWPQLVAMEGFMSLVWKGLGFASVVCLSLGAVARYRGNKPNFLLHLVPTLFLISHGVIYYRTWSADPQLFHYVFQLFALIVLILFSFYHAAFDTGLEWRGHLTLYGLLGIGMGILAVPDSDAPWLYAGFACWALLDRPVAQPHRRRSGKEEDPQ